MCGFLSRALGGRDRTTGCAVTGYSRRLARSRWRTCLTETRLRSFMSYLVSAFSRRRADVDPMGNPRQSPATIARSQTTFT